jgi:FKBP-type peptidyl-prolyl cis-trans isomerase SlyD
MDIEVGMIFQAQSPQGPANLRVVEVGDETIKGDFNHPLAGERLNFDVKVISVREATDAELAAMTSCDPAGGCGTGCCG